MNRLKHRTLELQQALRVYLVLWWLMIIYLGINHILPHALANSPLFYISIDNTFWLFHYIGLAEALRSGPWLLWILELFILICSILLFIKHSYRLSILFILIHVLLSLFVQTYSTILTKISVIPVIVFIPFLFKSANFKWAWNFPRYYLIYLMVSAGLFKFIHGGVFHPGQMDAILWNQHSDLLFYGSDHIALGLSNVLSGLSLNNIPYVLVALLECAFIIGLFTRKLDRFLLLALLLLCAIFYLILRIHVLEMLFLILPLFQISEDNL